MSGNTNVSDGNENEDREVISADVDKCSVSAIVVGATWLPSYTSDQLFVQMCECEATIKFRGQYVKTSKYYLEAARYAILVSSGDFTNAKRPIFPVYLNDFTSKLKSELAGLCNGTLDKVVKDAVFRIFRARHRIVFYEHIQPSAFRWEFT